MDLKEKRLLTVNETEQYLGLGKTRTYQLTKTPGFPAFKIGRKVLVDREKLDEWIKNLSDNHGHVNVKT